MAIIPQLGLTEHDRRRKRINFRIEYLIFYGHYTPEEAKNVAAYLETLYWKEKSGQKAS